MEPEATQTKIYKIDFGTSSDWSARSFEVAEHPGPILEVAVQYNRLVAWYEADTSIEKGGRRFWIVGTGWERPPADFTHRGSVMIGPFAAHLYEHQG